MVSSAGVFTLLLLMVPPAGPELGASEGPAAGSCESAGFAGAWTGEEFIPAAPAKTEPAAPVGYVDSDHRQMARSMFEEPLPPREAENPFIEELPKDPPPQLIPVPGAPTAPGLPEPPTVPPDPAYEDGFAPAVPPPASAGSKRLPVDMTPLIDEPLESGPCDTGMADCGATCDALCEAPCSFSDWLWGIQVSGWIAQGSTLNTDRPGNGSNFPVGFNDDSNAYQLNQVYAIIERPVCDCGFGWDIGGRVDLLYGTDQRYTTARGLETRGDLSPRWNSDDYGLALPQLYAEFYAPVLSGINFKVGHFYTLIGYEVVPAAENFFYSHTYTMLYGEPFTHTGALGSTKLGNFTLHSGITRGWDNWEDNNNDLAFLAGVTWTSQDEQTSLAFAYHGGREQDEPPTNTDFRSMFSLVARHQINPCLQYVIQYDHGFEPDGAQNGTRDADWHGLAQYLFYTINPCWKAGLRFEWFCDEDGTRVDPVNIGDADLFAVTAGLNYTPHPRLVVRPSFRWDWTTTSGRRPYVNFSRHDQITLDMDVIVKF